MRRHACRSRSGDALAPSLRPGVPIGSDAGREVRIVMPVEAMKA
jgi:hypothetical protein